MKTIQVSYHLCPHCFRAVPAALGETYCPNDGKKLLQACPRCNTRIHSPYVRYCVRCGQSFASQSSASEEGGEL